MEQNVVIAVTGLGNEAVQNPGRFKKISEIAIKFIPQIFKRHQSALPPVEGEGIPKSASQNSSAAATTATPSPNPAIAHPSHQLPNNIVPASSAEIRNPVRRFRLQIMWSHPIFLMIREQELGKFALSLVAPTTVALLITNGGKSQTVLVHFVLMGLSAGCMAIWHGIAFRGTVPHTANIIEQLGIVIILVSFNSLVASALPMEFAWVPILCGCSCVLPFVIAVLPVDENTAGGD